MKIKLPNRIDPFVNGTAATNSKGHARANGKPAAPTGGPEPSATAPVSSSAERDTDGRFQPGCKPGPGNPFAKRVASLRKALLESVSEADVTQLGQRLLAQALAGDTAAAKVLLSYVVGKPTATIDPDHVELEAWKLLLSWPTAAEVLAASWAVQPSVAAETVANIAPGTVEDFIKRAADEVPLSGAMRVIRRREAKGR